MIALKINLGKTGQSLAAMSVSTSRHAKTCSPRTSPRRCNSYTATLNLVIMNRIELFLAWWHFMRHLQGHVRPSEGFRNQTPIQVHTTLSSTVTIYLLIISAALGNIYYLYIYQTLDNKKRSQAQTPTAASSQWGTPQTATPIRIQHLNTIFQSLNRIIIQKCRSQYINSPQQS